MSTDDEAFMARFIRRYDNTEDPCLRAELLASSGIHPASLASARKRLARGNSTAQPTTEQTTTPSVPPVRRKKPRTSRRPSTPRGTSGPRTYTVTRTTRKSRRSGTRTVVTRVVTVVTTTTVTTFAR
ncbi:hypothetical protein [Streptomyces albidoflavus]|uniref:hypothetical protein n=1 Tax=Streptomyces albidoflavus TaxID=1886 RepID=UPI00188D700C|nr:hypothetical protein [Streptomyces albidoflavus]MBF4136060.1 hypothetical protein [Streptomyces albidoflavus]